MAAIEQRIQQSLDEGRILILVIQILFGFEYRSFFEPGLDALPAWTHEAKLGTLGLELIAFALALLPSSYHHIVEHGADTERLLVAANRAIAAALLPFAIAVGADVGLASLTVKGVGTATAAALGGGAAIAASAIWYGRPAARRRPRTAGEDEMSPTSVERKIQHVLTEARMVLPGAQALLGFQLSVTLMDGFHDLPGGAQVLHLADALLTTAAILLLVAPAAYHRIAEHGEETARFHRIASRLVLASMVPLALSMGGELAIVALRVTDRSEVAAALGAVTCALLLGSWFGIAWGVRLARGRASRVAARQST